MTKISDPKGSVFFVFLKLNESVDFILFKDIIVRY